ncbi:putative Haloacid dehalogenase like hydrolase HAD hyrolase like [Trypanosoma vivax]|nr:putative Haloacid dehalogenase like hydrolase HAD hyrolase like [Trypanosoma vivax]
MPAVSTPVTVTAEVARELLDSVRYVLLDIDGVVWSGADVLPRIPKTLRYLRSIGKQIRFITNNASVSRAKLVRQFSQRGIEDVQEHDIYNSGFAAALRLKKLFADELGGDNKDVSANRSDQLVKRNIFVIGEEGLHEELRHVLAPGYVTYGMELHDPERMGGYNSSVVATAWRQRVLPTPLNQSKNRSGDMSDWRGGISLKDLSPFAVVVGLDLHFNMVKLACASLLLQGERTREPSVSSSKNVYFIATNEDPQIPTGEEGQLLPGAGAVVSALSVASGRRPDFVCGKPNADLAQVLFEVEGIVDPRVCLMVGDRLGTDVAFGNAANCRTMFVLSGAETMKEVAHAELTGNIALLPDYVATSLASLLPD